MLFTPTPSHFPQPPVFTHTPIIHTDIPSTTHCFYSYSQLTIFISITILHRLTPSTTAHFSNLLPSSTDTFTSDCCAHLLPSCSDTFISDCFHTYSLHPLILLQVTVFTLTPIIHWYFHKWLFSNLLPSCTDTFTSDCFNTYSHYPLIFSQVTVLYLLTSSTYSLTHFIILPTTLLKMYSHDKDL